MKKETKAGRRPEMNIKLGAKTIERFVRLYAEKDYSLIADTVTPPVDKSYISKLLGKVRVDADTTMPVSIAKAVTKYYLKKEQTAKELAA